MFYAPYCIPRLAAYGPLAWPKHNMQLQFTNDMHIETHSGLFFFLKKWHMP